MDAGAAPPPRHASDEEAWSGARASPGGGGWFGGRGFWLNELQGEELGPDDPRLTEEERRGFEVDSPEVTGDVEHYHVFELPVSDSRSDVPNVNRGALRLSELNHDPKGLRAALFTSYDFVDDAGWLQEELRLRRDVPITLCTHSWYAHKDEESRALDRLKEHFDDVAVHFPKTSGGGTCRTFRSRRWLAARVSSWMRSLSQWRRLLAAMLLSSASQAHSAGRSRGWDDWDCTVHAKLLLLEFHDRLRVAVTTANLSRTHWRFRGEAVWVQDFPRAAALDPEQGASHGQPHASRLLAGGAFASGLAHFVADLLTRSPGGRQRAWTAALAAFDFSGAAAKLVPSLPGLFPPARPRPRGGGAVLRLWAECTAARARHLSKALLARAPSGSWTLRLAEGASAPCIGSLSLESLAALGAAVELGLQVRPEVELFVSDSWGDELDDQESEGDHQVTWLVRAVIEGSCHVRWVEDMPVLMSCIEVDYGLYALRKHLEGAEWLQEEEKHYAAITSSIDWLRNAWLEALDACIGREAACQSPGPTLIAPNGDAPLHMTYVELAKRHRLCAHSPPWHAPGRERVPNHSKMIVRHLWDADHGRPYGWVYVGSHNLSAWAWGSIMGDQCHSKIWVGNRELGVLLVQPRPTESDPDTVEVGNLFEATPLPFGLPLVPADLDGREVQTWNEGENGGMEQSYLPDDTADWGNSTWGRRWWWVTSWWSGPWNDNSGWQDASDSSDSELSARGSQDWRLKATSNWWWA